MPEKVSVDYPNLEDAALIQMITRAHNEALGVLYDRYSRLVFSLAFNIVGDTAVAEEITQDVFTSVWQKAATYQEEQSRVSTWISSITRYRAIDVLRRRGSRPEQNSVSWSDVSVETLFSAENTPDGAEVAMLQQEMRAAIISLPHDQKLTLVLAYFKGYSHREIAEVLGEPLGTVKTRIRLAMQKLRKVLGEDVAG